MPASLGSSRPFKQVDIEGERIKLQIWDTAGQEAFRSITFFGSRKALVFLMLGCWEVQIGCQDGFKVKERLGNKKLFDVPQPIEHPKLRRAYYRGATGSLLCSHGGRLVPLPPWVIYFSRLSGCSARVPEFPHFRSDMECSDLQP